MKKLYGLIFIGLTFLTLPACIFVAGAAAGAAGVAIVYDHRKLEKILLDETIAKNVKAAIHANPLLRKNDNVHIEVTCFNQVVLLTGEANTEALKNEAFNSAHAVADIKRIYNQIAIKRPVSALTMANDSWITTRIKTEMLATKGLQSSTIKVVTANSIVYLMGTVNENQADIAVDIARQVHGVQRVMKIFQYKK